jgi:UDP-glucose 4-epimerase
MQRSYQAKNPLAKTWLITGGRGFIGTNLRIALDEKYPGSRTAVVDNLTYNTGYERDKVKEENYYIDVTNYEELYDVFEAVTPDYVVHLAASTEVRKSTDRPMLCFDTNVAGTLNCLNLCRAFKVKKVVLASSCGVAGDQFIPVDEGCSLDPRSPYASSKVCGEFMADSYIRLGVPVVVLRFSNVYGPWSKHKNSVIPEFMKQYLSKKPFIVYGDGLQSRNFLYAQDAANAILRAVEHKSVGTFCIASTISYRINELVEIFEDRFGYKIKRETRPRNKGEVGEIKISTVKARSVLHFQCEYSLLDGLSETYEWYKENLQ